MPSTPATTATRSPASLHPKTTRASAPSPTGEQAVRKECGFSQVLVDDLKAHRLQITRAISRGISGWRSIWRPTPWVSMRFIAAIGPVRLT